MIGRSTGASAKPRRLRPLVLVVGLLVLLAYALPIALFVNERVDRHTPLNDAEHQIALGLKITAIDFVRGQATLHILPEGGTLMRQNGRLSREVVLETDGGGGLVHHTFKPDVPLTPWVVSVSSDSGDILDYPLDHYVLDFEISGVSGGDKLALDAKLEDLPHGLKATLTTRPAEPGEIEVTVAIARTPTIVFVALLSTLSLVLVSAAACAVAWQVAYRGRKIEFSMMVWVAALLFVIPTVRNALPGGVPPGALIDFAIFFWLQIAVVVAMSSLVVTWIRRTG